MGSITSFSVKRLSNLPKKIKTQTHFLKKFFVEFSFLNTNWAMVDSKAAIASAG